MAAAPMFANQQPLGVLGAFSYRPAAFSQQQLTLLRALADHAAAAISNRQLLVALRESEIQLRDQAAELERTLAAHRALDEIARSIVDAEPAEVLQQVVDMASDLLGSDGAHLTLMTDQRDSLVPMAMAGHTDPEIRAWLHSRRFPLGGGINGLAALTREAVWTEDYVDDDRWPHDPDDDSVEMLELGAVIVAPLLGPGAEALGTLAITYREPRPIDPRDVTLLEELARQASIAARNSSLYAELREQTEALQASESRYRNLVDHSPDLVWAGRCRWPHHLHRRDPRAPDRLSLTTRCSTGPGWSLLTRRVGRDCATQLGRDRGTARRRAAVPRPDAARRRRRDDGRDQHDRHGRRWQVRRRARIAARHHRARAARRGPPPSQSAELAANQERASLARELHDSVTQALFSMGLTLRTIELLFDRDPDAARAKFGELRELQNDALAEMRTLIFELRPRGLETDGLEQALRNHAAAVSGRTGLTVQVETSLPERLPLDTEEALYRIGQEALHNVVKHANAHTAEIRLVQKEDMVELFVEDDGAGFDPSLVSGTKLGLIAMRQRAERLGGTVAIAEQTRCRDTCDGHTARRRRRGIGWRRGIR